MTALLLSLLLSQTSPPGGGYGIFPNAGQYELAGGKLYWNLADDPNTWCQWSSADTVVCECGGAAILTMDATSITTPGVFTVLAGGSIDLSDDVATYWGNADDYEAHYDSTDTRWELNSADVDGGGTPGNVCYVNDGGDDIVCAGGLSLADTLALGSAVKVVWNADTSIGRAAAGAFLLGNGDLSQAICVDTTTADYAKLYAENCSTAASLQFGGATKLVGSTDGQLIVDNAAGSEGFALKSVSSGAGIQAFRRDGSTSATLYASQYVGGTPTSYKARLVSDGRVQLSSDGYISFSDAADIVGANVDTTVRRAAAAKWLFSGTDATTAGGQYSYPQSQTIADSGDVNPATGEVTPATSNFYLGTCSDADECTMTVNETGAVAGWITTMTNVSANAMNFADSAGVLELAGGVAFAMGQNDVLVIAYNGSAWIEVSRSDN